MQYKLEKETLTIFLEGDINSANADEVEENIIKVLSKKKFNEIVFDCEKLHYISSAGFRIILRIKRKFDNLKLTKVSGDISSLLTMVGFDTMVDVEK